VKLKPKAKAKVHKVADPGPAVKVLKKDPSPPPAAVPAKPKNKPVSEMTLEERVKWEREKNMPMNITQHTTNELLVEIRVQLLGLNELLMEALKIKG
jgi:hypothetical protein